MLPAEILHRIQIADSAGELKTLSLAASHSPRLLNADFGNIQQLHAPAALRQPDGMTSDSAGDIQRNSRWSAGKKLIVSAYKKGIGVERTVRAFTVLLVPQMLFSSPLSHLALT